MIKVAHIGKSAALTDIQDLPVCLCQKINCIFQTLLVDILGSVFPQICFSSLQRWLGEQGANSHIFS